MTFFKKAASSILFAGLCAFVFSSCAPEGAENQANHQNNEANAIGAIVPNAPAIVADFTTSAAEASVIEQIGDFVVRDGVLLAYTGREQHVEIPADIGITSIERNAFAHNSVILSIRIPRDVVSIRHEWGALPSIFNLESIIVDPDNEYYASVDGVLFDKDLTEIVLIPMAKATPFTIPAGVTSLDESQFQHRTRLAAISIPASVTNIGRNAFADNTGLESITVEADNANFASIDGVLLNRDKTAIIHVPHAKEGAYIIPASVTRIERSQFSSRSRLSSVVIPAGITQIPDTAFWGASSLGSVIMPAGVTHIGDGAFRHTGLTSVDIPASVTHIGNDAFRNTRLSSVAIPAGVTHIGSNAFADSASLASVTISASVASIGNNAFGHTPRLSSITVEAGNNFFASMDGVLFNNAKTTIVHFPHAKEGSYIIPAGVTNITAGQFDGRSGLTAISIPASVTNIGRGAFEGCANLTSITVADDNQNFASVDGVLFNRDRTTLVRFPQARQGAYAIPDTVARIEHSAFAGSTLLREVDIPSSVTSIGELAFARTGLEMVVIPNSVTSLGWGAFRDNPNLVTIVLPDGLSLAMYSNGKGGGEDFFLGSLNLQRIIVRESNRNYRSVDGVLFSRDGRTLVRFPPGRQGHYSIPNGVTSIAYKAFYNAAFLSSVTIPPSVTSIGDFAFDGSASLISIDIPEGVASIGMYAFARNTSLIAVNISASVTSIGDFVFFDSINLRHVSVDENNRSFVLANGVIFNRGMTEIAQILPGGTGHHHLMAQSE